MYTLPTHNIDKLCITKDVTVTAEHAVTEMPCETAGLLAVTLRQQLTLSSVKQQVRHLRHPSIKVFAVHLGVIA